LIAIALGFVFLRSALAHLANPYFFLSSVYDYQLGGPRMGEAVALVLPHLELVVGVCMIVGLWPRACLSLAAGMFWLFLLIQVIAWMRGLSISCGCFGASGSETIGFRSMAFVGAIALTATAGAFAARR